MLAQIVNMVAQKDFIVTLINAGKSTDNIQSLMIDCYGDKAHTRRSIRSWQPLMLGEMAKKTQIWTCSLGSHSFQCCCHQRTCGC